MSNYIFVDVEALGTSPVNGTMTEFGAVHGTSKKTFHGVLFEGTPDPENPAVPVVGAQIDTDANVASRFTTWLKEVCGNDRPVFVSDNVAYDWMWIAGMYDRAGFINPFGHSGRRISDFWAGLQNNFSDTQTWKKFRITPHDHNPVNDAMGNVEAFEYLVKEAERQRNLETNRLKAIEKRIVMERPYIANELYKDKRYYKVLKPFGTNYKVNDIFWSKQRYKGYAVKGPGSSIMVGAIDLETSDKVELL